ncbi:MAG TPA: hypothetical protein VMJ33_12015 [Gallionella sp.]|nr:hypothetical protein [Gallionella sp.]
MKTKLFPVGTSILAIKNVGPVHDGQPGIVTGVVEVPFFFWKRPMYLCTFFGNIKVATKPNEVTEFNHGQSRDQLEKPEDNSVSVAKQLQRIRPLKN